MNKLLLGLVIVIAGVFVFFYKSTHTPRTYKIKGETITCEVSYLQHCGISLGSCSNGKAYNCMTDLEQVQ